MDSYVITISRKFGSMGHAIALRMGDSLGIPVYDRSVLEAMEEGRKPFGLKTAAVSAAAETSAEDPAGDIMQTEPSVPEQEREEPAESSQSGLFSFFRKKSGDAQQLLFERQAADLRLLAAKGPCIIIGRCGDWVFRDYPRVMSIFIYAEDEVRVKNCMELLHTDEESARELIERQDCAREEYRRRFCPELLRETDCRHILIDSGKFGVENSADVLAALAKSLFSD